ncbi:hypothetical protein [Marinoscillum furvescens]|uniref:Uncharacterized protein n=1 Tax=Marinoscillum furvescens DSM 4134 TaxID=1122208 RepID=A0A3D9KXL4_MARFU|nr:hypothetical protein [Marinoscillum furvescens]RED93838.1 hypothetical protein C7460_12316 [Marinoscillum furvescens DSM 4134]
MENIPSCVSLTFLACVVATFGFIYFAIQHAGGRGSNVPIFFTTLCAIWVFVVSLLSIQGFFQDYHAWPPRLMVGLAILLALLILLMSLSGVRRFIAEMPITTLTYIHIIRVPVEIVLWWLFINGVVSEVMTFEGVNYDILSGISAPFAGLFLVGMKSKSRIAAIIWNLLALGLLINIVVRAIMATPYFYNPVQFDVPNLAVFYFPYILLPLFVVPGVLFCHVASLYKLIFITEDTED